MGPNIKRNVLTVSQVIGQLKQIWKEYGDLPVIMEIGEVVGSVGHGSIDVVENPEDKSKSTVVIEAEYIDSLDNMLERIK